MTEYQPPKAFFSYAWTSESHKARVKALVDRLRGDGVDAILDQTHLRDGDDMFHFMERIANDPDLKKVVAVCDQRYQTKVNGRDGGSGTEGSIMSPEVYDQIGEGPNKYVAVAFETDERGRGYVPTMFATRLYIDMSTDELLDQNYERLLRFLHDRPEPAAPIGAPPAFLFDDNPGDALLHAKARLVRQAVERGRSVTTPWIEFTQAVLEVFDRFSAPRREGNYDGTEALRQASLTLPARDALVDVVRFLVREDLLTVPMLTGLFERLGNLWQQHKEAWGVQAEATAHTRATVLELVLYTLTVLMQEDRPDLFSGVLTASYIFVRYSERQVVEFGFLQQNTRYLDEAYLRSSNSRREDGLAFWLRERATSRSVPWEDLVQADALITLSSMQERRTQPGRFPEAEVWWPATQPFWAEQQFPLFLRFSSRAVIARWLPVFRVSDVETFLREFDTLITTPSGTSYLGGAHPRYTYSQHLLGTRP